MMVSDSVCANWVGRREKRGSGRFVECASVMCIRLGVCLDLCHTCIGCVRAARKLKFLSEDVFRIQLSLIWSDVYTDVESRPYITYTQHDLDGLPGYSSYGRRDDARRQAALRNCPYN